MYDLSVEPTVIPIAIRFFAKVKEKFAASKQATQANFIPRRQSCYSLQLTFVGPQESRVRNIYVTEKFQ
jgi:hypothetical protein